MRLKTLQGHLAQVDACRRTVLNYEQMIKIVDLNEREGQLFLDDNEDSNNKIARHKNKIEKRGRQIGTRPWPRPMTRMQSTLT
ncbi:hypothetical protein K443DRAFT_308826 [Laccaria amethystina LaAM-08-1]|uniref:Uncharacterized protein n=1 Tax=Laccaria amethystina LaAM-08-1 TaxID=1095629 RepID=A0A0C9YD39_9AGAR|nr:hypothetical protein K443DRAFT_308826 [Laccaria amethystina LaAM-08-1]